MSANPFQNQRALITGGSSGIGLAIAKELARRGASVAILARDPGRLKIALEEIEACQIAPTQEFSSLQADVVDLNSLQAALDFYLVHSGPPDLLFNVAGFARPGYVEELPLDVFRQTMDIDYHGTVNVTKLLLNAMLMRGSGHIINFSSIAGVIGVFGYTAYSGAKFAVRGFSDALRSELAPRGIRVSIVYPPDTDTPQLTWENQYKPDETRTIAGSDKPVSAEKVARLVLKGVARGSYAIAPASQLMYQAGTRLGGLIYPIMDLLVRDARKKKAKKQSS